MAWFSISFLRELQKVRSNARLSYFSSEMTIPGLLIIHWFHQNINNPKNYNIWVWVAGKGIKHHDC